MKRTRILSIDSSNIENHGISEAADIIRHAGTVVFPTETVYGIGASIDSVEGIKGIFKAKGRPTDNPLIVHISSIEMMMALVADPLSEKVRRLIHTFWPGPLTLILKKSAIVSQDVTANLDTVAIRYPKHPIALALIEKANVPIAAPSANISGRSSSTRFQHAFDDLDGRVDAIIHSEDSEIGLESTVLDVSRDVPVLLRPGFITKEQIEQVIGKVDIPSTSEASSAKPMSPGMKYAHYAPKAPMYLVMGETSGMVERINEEIASCDRNLKIGVLCCDETLDAYRHETTFVQSLGSRFDLSAVASRLFASLRTFDDFNVDLIFCESFEERGIGVALMNRLVKASGNRIIRVETRTERE
ncbi:MAG TPA: threonylcarbamoyl-AMP synthase [Erysipelotrichaceae bacterium]|nr:threonylcarbamoyl-AMP synthase [Erysipelotrichaceae bacterium]